MATDGDQGPDGVALPWFSLVPLGRELAAARKAVTVARYAQHCTDGTALEHDQLRWNRFPPVIVLYLSA